MNKQIWLGLLEVNGEEFTVRVEAAHKNQAYDMIRIEFMNEGLIDLNNDSLKTLSEDATFNMIQEG